MRNCASFCLRVHISAKSDASSDLSVLGVLDFCSMEQEQEKVAFCCGYGWRWRRDAGQDFVLVPFDNQRVCHSFCHHCHRKAIF